MAIRVPLQCETHSSPIVWHCPKLSGTDRPLSASFGCGPCGPRIIGAPQLYCPLYCALEAQFRQPNYGTLLIWRPSVLLHIVRLLLVINCFLSADVSGGTEGEREFLYLADGWINFWAVGWSVGSRYGLRYMLRSLVLSPACLPVDLWARWLLRPSGGICSVCSGCCDALRVAVDVPGVSTGKVYRHIECVFGPF